jgi:aryl-alcohol dehydrogenase-like predicted oxidoreductase
MLRVEGRCWSPPFCCADFAAGFAPLLEQLREIAARHGATPAAVALAWAISHDPVVVIPGASTIGQLEANAAAADIKLTEDEQQTLTATASQALPPKGHAQPVGQA